MPNLWKIRYFPDDMKSLPKLTFGLTSLCSLIYAIVLAGGLPAQETPPAAATPPAAPAQPETPPPPTDQSVAMNPRLATATLRQSRDSLLARASISADITETIVIGERKMEAKGKYLQGPNRRMRLEYQVRAGDLYGQLLEVCDGTMLWTQQIIGKPEEIKAAAEAQSTEQKPAAEAAAPVDPAAPPKQEVKPRVTRRDVEKIMQAAAENGSIPESLLKADLGLGGLPALLSSLEDSMMFTSVREERIDGRPFTVIEGAWNRNYAQQLGGKDGKSFPEHVPESVRIYFDRETLFPQRIVYLKKHATRNYSRPMLTLDFINVQLDGPVDEVAFHYEPPKGVSAASIDDTTNLYLQQLTAPRKNAGSGAPAAGTPEGAPPQGQP